MKNIDLLSAITAIVAVYAASLSTYIFLTQQREKKRVAVVRLYHGFMPVGNDLGSSMLILEISNPGYRAITLDVPGVLLPDGKQAIFINSPSNVSFPHELREGQRCFSWITLREISLELIREGFSGDVELKGFCKDSLGKIYESNPHNIRTDEWC